jgi:hypothetical protein
MGKTKKYLKLKENTKVTLKAKNMFTVHSNTVKLGYNELLGA